MNILTNRALPTNFAVGQDPGSATGALRRLWAAWRRRRAQARAFKELRMLDDRQLADIGLQRAGSCASVSRAALLPGPGGGGPGWGLPESRAGLIGIYSSDGSARPDSSCLS